MILSVTSHITEFVNCDFFIFFYQIVLVSLSLNESWIVFDLLFSIFSLFFPSFVYVFLSFWFCSLHFAWCSHQLFFCRPHFFASSGFVHSSLNKLFLNNVSCLLISFLALSLIWFFISIRDGLTSSHGFARYYHAIKESIKSQITRLKFKIHKKGKSGKVKW